MLEGGGAPVWTANPALNERNLEELGEGAEEVGIIGKKGGGKLCRGTEAGSLD